MINKLFKPIAIISIMSNLLSAQIYICKTYSITDYKRNYKLSAMSKEEAKEYNTPFRISLEDKTLKIKGKKFVYSDSEISLEGNKFDYYKGNKAEVGLMFNIKNNELGLSINTKKMAIISKCKTWEQWYDR